MRSRLDIQKRRTWELRLERYRASGLTVTRFCEQERVPVHAFYYWSRRLGAGSAGQASKRPRRAVMQKAAATPDAAQGAVVRFRWNAAVEVLVPADCLAAIRCLAECLPHSPQEQADSFQELVLTS